MSLISFQLRKLPSKTRRPPVQALPLCLQQPLQASTGAGKKGLTAYAHDHYMCDFVHFAERAGGKKRKSKRRRLSHKSGATATCCKAESTRGDCLLKWPRTRQQQWRFFPSHVAVACHLRGLQRVQAHHHSTLQSASGNTGNCRSAASRSTRLDLQVSGHLRTYPEDQWLESQSSQFFAGVLQQAFVRPMCTAQHSRASKKLPGRATAGSSEAHPSQHCARRLRAGSVQKVGIEFLSLSRCRGSQAVSGRLGLLR